MMDDFPFRFLNDLPERERQRLAAAAQQRQRRRFWVAVEFACWLVLYGIVLAGMMLTAGTLQRSHNANIEAARAGRAD
jgi:hypothetical protein